MAAKYDPLMHKQMYGDMDDMKNILPVVKALWLQTGAMHALIEEIRKRDAVAADNFTNTFLVPSRNAMLPYMPYLVNQYPQNFPQETRDQFGVG